MSPHDMPPSPPPEDDLAHLRVPPHSIEAEQSVLGGLLLDNNAWDRCADLLMPDDFYRLEHRLIFSAIGALVNSCKPADVITVFERIQATGKAAEVGGITYIGALSQSVPSAMNVRRYAEIVRERAIFRKLIAASDEIATVAFNPEGKSAIEVLDRAQSAVLRVAEQGANAGEDWHGPESMAVHFIDKLNADQGNGAPTDVISTGLSDLDDKLNGGPREGELVSIFMRSGMGKTAMGLNILTAAAKRGEPGAFFTLEMPGQGLFARQVASEARVHLTKFKRPERLNDLDWGELSRATELLAQLPFKVNERGGLNINQIRAQARAAKRKLGGLRLIVVDHLGLTKGTDPRANRTYQLAEVTGGLKSLAKELRCAVILLGQIKREVDGRSGDNMPTLADIRDTSSVEDDSDIVIFGHREIKNKPDLGSEWRYYMELAIAKQRDGELCRLPMMFIPEHMRMDNWPKDIPIPTTKVRNGTKPSMD